MERLTDKFQTDYWHLLEDGRVVCDVCPRHCALRDGKKGACYIREASDGQIVLTSYGRVSGFAVDPIEKKPLNHFFPASQVLSFGTEGCNFGCKFCQNWHISKSRERSILNVQATPESIAQLASQHQCRSVAFTYNDPVIFFEYARDTAIACHDLGIKTVAVSAGYMCEQPRAEFYQHIDAANIDLKAMTDKFYRKVCSGTLAPVLDTLLYLKHETDTWLEITTLIIPGYNDSPKELEQLSAWIVDNLGPDVPLHFSAFHPDFKMLDVASTSLESLRQARQIALNRGVHFVYTGNLVSDETESTYCPGCSQLVIRRHRYQVLQYSLNERGQCPHCHTSLPGCF